MPNHVKNVLKFKNLKSKSDIDFILRMIADTITLGLDNPDYNINFNKIIPEPEKEEECPADCLRSEHTRAEKDSSRPWFDWYTWRLKYWGTKWGAYDSYTLIGKSYIKFVFGTAWNTPEPIIRRLEVLGYELECRYADEDLGSNCGIYSYTSEHGWTLIDESDMQNSYRFAKNLWDKY